MRVLCFDPSGSFDKEGDGTSGYAEFEDGKLVNFGHIKAKESSCVELYFWEHIKLIADRKPSKIVIESFKLFAHKSKAQSWSEMLTPQLIGCIRLHCYINSIPLFFQDPKDKIRVADPILVHMEILEQTDGGRYKALGRQTIIHERDAIRHGVFYHRYNKER